MELSDYELGGLYGWNSLALIRVMPDHFFTRRRLEDWDSAPTLGFVLITTTQHKDEPGNNPNMLKLPGGSRDSRDPTPAHTIRREVRQECGLDLPLHAFRYERKWLGFHSKKSLQHWKILFTATCPMKEVQWVSGNFQGREGETPWYLRIDTFYERKRQNLIREDYYAKLVEYALILPAGRDLVPCACAAS